MNLSQGSKPSSRFAALISLIIVNIRLCGSETSGEYLQKAMIELQELNVPSNSITMHNRLSANHYQYADYDQNDYSQDNVHRKLSTNNADQDIRHQKKPIANNAFAEQALPAANNIVQYYAVRDPVAVADNYPKIKQPEPLVLTRAKLAALYKQALEKGSAISVAALTQALNAAGGNGNAVPQVDHLQLPVKFNPLYNYYFFPLKSFASELQGDHQHQQAALVPMYAATEIAENSQKQLINPLFVAIGTFISMALLFMMGVLFLPKLPHLDLFNARVGDNDDFLRLTTFVTNAIDGHNRGKNFSIVN